MIIPCDELVLTLLCERGGERGVVMFTSGLLLPLLLLLTTGRQRVVGLQTVSLDNIAFRQEASQSLTLGQYKPGSKSSTYLNNTVNQFNPSDWRFCSFLGAFRAL